MNRYSEIFDDDETETPAPPKKRGPGRPLGVKNKPKETFHYEKVQKKLYDGVKGYLTIEQRQYIDNTIDGNVDVDPKMELDILVRMSSLAASRMLSDAAESGGISQPTAVFINTYRQSLADLAKLNKQLTDDSQKRQQDTDDMVSITSRGTALERLEGALSEHPS